MVDLKIDVNKLTTEINTHVKPVTDDYGITCTSADAELDSFDFHAYSGMRKNISTDQYLLPSGNSELELVYWPKVLANSYLKELGLQLSKTLELGPPRCRLSMFNNRSRPTSIGYHYDKHTPYRVHVALQTNPNCLWLYRRDGQAYRLHQPVLDHPVLVNTGEVEHDIIVPPNNTRVHLWYQFHQRPAQALLDNLIDRYKLTLNRN